ncbi:MAG: alpha/beta fold hydrolase, partial [Pseudomonadota bacterium]
MKRLLTLLVAALVGGCAGGGDGAAPVPRFEDVGAGEAFPIDGAAGFDTRRGYLIVHERAGDPASGEVRVPVAIVRARTPNGAPPVVFLQGGPGVGRLDAANYPTAYPWTTQRDFIVIGPRGTAHADPALPCPEYAEALVADAPGGLVAAATVCRRRYGEEGIDVASYHTAASARDMEDLRVALGIDAWSLYGLSYGTRLALTYARDYPDGVASMILDSPLPHGADYDAESPANFADALRRVASACAAVPACRAAYPDLYQRFSDAVAALKEEGAAADRVAHISLGAPRAVARAPLLMDALARGDAGPFGPSAAASSGTSRFTFAWGLRISVWCAEAFPFRDRADARAPLDTFA